MPLKIDILFSALGVCHLLQILDKFWSQYANFGNKKSCKDFCVGEEERILDWKSAIWSVMRNLPLKFQEKKLAGLENRK